MNPRRKRREDRGSACRRRRTLRRKRPLWLTAPEAETLLLLSGSSPLDGGATEPNLFRKLGNYLRGF